MIGPLEKIYLKCKIKSPEPTRWGSGFKAFGGKGDVGIGTHVLEGREHAKGFFGVGEGKID